MQSILEKLYGDRLSPCEQIITSGTEYKEVAELEKKIEEKLKLQLEEPQKELLDRLLTAQIERQEFEEVQLFTDAFSLGISVMVEVLASREGCYLK